MEYPELEVHIKGKEGLFSFFEVNTFDLKF
jgi:hypothetical protein